MAELQKDPITRGDFLGFGILGAISGAILTLPPVAFVLSPVIKTNILGQTDIDQGWHQVATVDDPWEAAVDRIRAREVLGRLGAHHRAALTLRYLDGLPVPEVARHLDRTVHATEALLVRARAAFRRIYEGEEGSP